MNILFLDTETTGLENGRILQLAYKNRGESNIFVEYYKPPVPIEFEAMGTHHITEDKVANMSSFIDTPTYSKLQKLLEKSVLVAHNAKFDIGILAIEGIKTNKFICTYKVAYRLYDYPNHKLQSLRYRWGVDADNAIAHDAEGDVMVLEKIFEYMVKDYSTQNKMSEKKTLEKFIEISSEPSLLRKIHFGKCKGMSFEEIMRTDFDYFLWMKNKMDNKSDDLIFTLDYNLKRKAPEDTSVPF